MLYVTLCNDKGDSTTKERIARRVPFQYPAGMRVLGEYWLATSRPTVVIIAESESIAPIMAAIAEWDDVFEITVVPAMTAEEGIATARQAMAAAAR